MLSRGWQAIYREEEQGLFTADLCAAPPAPSDCVWWPAARFAWLFEPYHAHRTLLLRICASCPCRRIGFFPSSDQDVGTRTNRRTWALSAVIWMQSPHTHATASHPLPQGRLPLADPVSCLAKSFLRIRTFTVVTCWLTCCSLATYKEKLLFLTVSFGGRISLATDPDF